VKAPRDRVRRLKALLTDSMGLVVRRHFLRPQGPLRHEGTIGLLCGPQILGTVQPAITACQASKWVFSVWTKREMALLDRLSVPSSGASARRMRRLLAPAR
jgi:hypothetical protein